MSKISTAVNLFKKDKRLVIAAVYNYIVKTGILNFLSDELFLKLSYRIYVGHKLDLKNPKGFNEKLQWLKLYYRKPVFRKYVDKYVVKQIIAERIGKEFVIPTIGVWSSFDEIDVSKMPNQFVLKCNHDSGSVIVCKNKYEFDYNEAKHKLTKSLQKDMYYWGREWVYKDISRKIIAEEYLSDDKEELIDYKFMCFNGSVKCVFTVTNRLENMHVTFYDLEWNIMPFERHYPADDVPIKKPNSLNEMIRLASILSKGMPFVRIDFYEVKGKPYFGEMTFFPGCGFEMFRPEEWDLKLGSWIQLPKKFV